jgi:hypothetical protein
MFTKRSLFLLSSLFLFSVAACGSSTQNSSDGGTTNSDMASTNPDNKLCQGAGCIGAPCTAATDCTEGANGAAVCWTGTLLNNPKLITTQDGYCTRECTADTDCGTGKCYNVPGAAPGKMYCVARCSTATTCRHPGYSCAFDGASGGICWPNGNFNCDPTSNDGSCDYGANKYLGGCIRAAYENTNGGICHLQCQVGTGTCPPDDRFASMPPQECNYLDTTVDAKGNPSATGDKFRGNVCFDQPASPLGPMQQCTYWSDCQDGLQCDRYAASQATQVCRQLCALGSGVQPSPLGLIKPAGAKPATNACTNPGETCSNSLRAGVQDGNPGLCQPK